MTIRQWLALLGLGFALLLPSLARGETARVDSFAGNRLIEDPSDAFFFPGALHLHTNRFYLGYRASSQDGEGGVAFGRNQTVLLHANRGASEHVARGALLGTAATPSDYDRVLGTLAGIPDASRPEAPGQPPVALDVVVGLPSGLGARVTAAYGLSRQVLPVVEPPTEPGGEPRTVSKESGSVFTRFELGAGWSQRNPNQSIDVGAELAINKAKSVAEDLITLESGGTPSLTAAARYVTRLADRYELGVIGVLDLRSYDMDLPQAKGSVERGTFSLRAGAGPRIALTDTVTLVGTVVLGISTDSRTSAIGEGDTKVESEGSTRDIVLPGLDLATEARLRDWLTVRGGFLSRFHFLSGTSKTGDLESESASTTSEYRAAAGLGMQIGDFRFDGTVSIPLITDGPDFLGGRAPGVFGQVDLVYAWGGGAAAAPSGRRDKPADPIYSPAVPPPADPYYEPPGADPYRQPPPPPTAPPPRPEPPPDPYYP